MGLLNKVAGFARSPQGRRTIKGVTGRGTAGGRGTTTRGTGAGMGRGRGGAGGMVGKLLRGRRR